MTTTQRTTGLIALLAVMLVCGDSFADRQNDTPQRDQTHSAAFTDSITVPETPENTYDAATGDISPWWDHSMSGAPYSLTIDPHPGGGFIERFNAEGDGALHATVILAERGKRLRFEGPLGLSGMAVTLVTTYEFRPRGPDSTVLTYHVAMSGALPEGVPEIVRKTWHHFMVERFKPYIESGRHRKSLR